MQSSKNARRTVGFVVTKKKEKKLELLLLQFLKQETKLETIRFNRHNVKKAKGPPFFQFSSWYIEKT